MTNYAKSLVSEEKMFKVSYISTYRNLATPPGSHVLVLQKVIQ